MEIVPLGDKAKGFSEDEITQLESFASLYMQAKLLILYSEEVDPDFRSNLQTIKELRDAFDHLMRIVIERFGRDPSVTGDMAGPEYCKINLQKAIGHVYRAAFDALDGTVMSLREKIINSLDAFPLEAVKDILPEYWDIRIKLEELNEHIGEHRAKKDIGNNIGEVYDRFIKDVEILKSFHKKLLTASPALTEYISKQGKIQDSSTNRQIIVAIIGAVVGGLIVAAYMALVSAH